MSKDINNIPQHVNNRMMRQHRASTSLTPKETDITWITPNSLKGYVHNENILNSSWKKTINTTKKSWNNTNERFFENYQITRRNIVDHRCLEMSKRKQYFCVPHNMPSLNQKLKVHKRDFILLNFMEILHWIVMWKERTILRLIYFLFLEIIPHSALVCPQRNCM